MHWCYTVAAESNETERAAELTATMSQQTPVTDGDLPTVTADNVTIVTDLPIQTGMYICIHVLGGEIRRGRSAI